MKKSLAVIAAAILMTLTACSGSASAGPSYKAPTQVKVRFEAYKTLPQYINANEAMKRREGKISITLSTPTGIVQNDYSQKMVNGAGDPVVFYSYSAGSPVSLSVQNGSSYGKVTCIITVDGVIVSRNESSSDYGVASCSGIAR
ncbi:hypothetical protein [Paeniglutamicibacter gangotriensis]|uniref:Lipoprotein n=1 Tax=Paeniglutamicibacter gangotriensis Lz1y TaxID=1276920 RepID=M7MPP6_9MICC|nr:hypothetical protein [Paeniglutamicibacter gangotriensis]EMQ98327.1 hypothetical protein ADIAG_02345 [Paeniglutamicibacter gangotriensis Lz1y]